MHCTNISRICAGAEAPKVAAPEVPYAQPGLKAILADAVQWDSFRDFLALGLPGGFMMQLEGNSYDITTLLAGLLGELAVRPQLTAPLDVRLQQHVRLSLPSPTGWRNALRLSCVCKLAGQAQSVFDQAMPEAFLLVGGCLWIMFADGHVITVQALYRWMRTMRC